MKLVFTLLAALAIVVTPALAGDDKKKDHVKTYQATIEINYMLYQKELIIITTNSVESTKPVLEEKTRRIKKSKTFKSKPENGDIFAGRSRRQHRQES